MKKVVAGGFLGLFGIIGMIVVSIFANIFCVFTFACWRDCPHAYRKF